jgi:hypothetical protein
MRKITSRKKAEQLMDDCLDELYRSSEPPITWADFRAKYGGVKVEGYKLHTIPKSKYVEIVERYRNRLHRMWHVPFDLALLGISPTVVDA